MRFAGKEIYSLDFGCIPMRRSGTPAGVVISDDFGRNKRKGKGHLGVDFAYRRKESGKPNLPEYTRHYYCPNDVVLAIACARGEVVRVHFDLVKNGTAVYVKHGKHLSVYRHLKDVTLVEGQVVSMGDVLGIVSHAPSNPNGFNHLHFEIWLLKHWTNDKRRWDRKSQAVDPEVFLDKWKNLDNAKL